MIACYILYSPSKVRYYIGITQDTIERRIASHNNKRYGGERATSFTNDWELFYLIKCASLAQAMKIEKHIKKMKSRVFIENLKKYPEITDRLLLKYS